VVIGHKGLTSTFLSGGRRAGWSPRAAQGTPRGGRVERAERNRITASLIEATGAERVQEIGFTLTLYHRNAENPKITPDD